MTVLGAVRVRRIGYRAGAGGVPALLPADAVLNLPRRRYSWGLQQLAVLFTQAGSYGQARQFVRAATGVSIGKRQLEQITAEAAADAAGFDPALPRGQQAGPLALSPDAKRVAMLPGALRPGAKAPGQRARNFEKRRGTGEKGHKRMAQAGCVFDVAVPDEPRTPEQILARQPGQQPPQAPEAAGTWYTADITAGCAETIAALFGQAGRRDPGHARTWIALADGDNHQIRQIQDQAAARRVPVTIWRASHFPDCGSFRILSWKGPELPGKIKNYSPEFRDEAARLVVETSRAIADVARELGISETSLGNWVRAYRKKHAEDEPPLQVSERARLRELERQNRELEMENTFLKKAAAYFAREHR